MKITKLAIQYRLADMNEHILKSAFEKIAKNHA
ncbi:MAG: hypothetical protein LEGION0398_MBIBDBAK_00193 [Legionellaceae bacterium]